MNEFDEGEPPKNAKGEIVAHIGVLPNLAGQLQGLGPGALFVIIEDPRDPSKIFPYTIISVSKMAIKLKCRCQDVNCTRILTLKGKVTGVHPQKT